MKKVCMGGCTIISKAKINIFLKKNLFNSQVPLGSSEVAPLEKTSKNVDILAFEENKYAATYLHFFADLSPLSSAIEVHFTEYDKQFCAFLNGKSSLLCEQLVY